MKTSFRVGRDALEKLLGVGPEASEEDLAERVNERIARHLYRDSLERIDFDETKVKKGEHDIKITVAINAPTEPTFRFVSQKIRETFPVS